MFCFVFFTLVHFREMCILLCISLKEITSVKHRPPRPPLLSDRGSFSLAIIPALLNCPVAEFSPVFFPHQSYGGDDGPIVSGVELFQKAEAPTMCRYLLKNITRQPVRPGNVVEVVGANLAC